MMQEVSKKTYALHVACAYFSAKDRDIIPLLFDSLPEVNSFVHWLILLTNGSHRPGLRSPLGLTVCNDNNGEHDSGVILGENL